MAEHFFAVGGRSLLSGPRDLFLLLADQTMGRFLQFQKTTLFFDLSPVWRNCQNRDSSADCRRAGSGYANDRIRVFFGGKSERQYSIRTREFVQRSLLDLFSNYGITAVKGRNSIPRIVICSIWRVNEVETTTLHAEFLFVDSINIGF